MFPISTTRAQQARLYLHIRAGFGLSDQNPTNSTEAASAALAEAVSYHSNGVEWSIAEIFALAEAVLAHRDDVAGDAPAIYDLDSLSTSVGSRDLSLLACKLCGAYIHAPNQWQDDGAGRPVAVTFPPDFPTERWLQ
ncbi:hypothetical protein MUY35_00915 [Aliiroseovarius sp. S1339]|uniref:hypothetical protein n=1 Tax=Aliiroseovarius sp. S1339 TaxID=2936990 RepID=UPI0020BFF736|nr:hypothetical protein [Aliiroseovarius sp. S1339]MCK8462406.1 hypothetical protein [Aliiroseovarius sp. S1339]